MRARDAKLGVKVKMVQKPFHSKNGNDEPKTWTFLHRWKSCYLYIENIEREWVNTEGQRVFYVSLLGGKYVWEKMNIWSQ